MMQNVIILGSGRSGTSMVAGTLRKLHYFMGRNLWPARESNAKGFFETQEVNEINEDLLEPIVAKRLRILGHVFFRHRPVKWQRWLACIPTRKKIFAAPAISKRIQKITSQPPYCFKDPRFSYTLSAWVPHLYNTVFICVFRDPASTAQSIVKECQTSEVLNHPVTGILMTYHQAINVWTAMYTYILKNFPITEKWLFIHYNQVLSQEGLEQIENAINAPIDRSFPDSSLRHSVSKMAIPQKATEIYQQLCRFAHYTNGS